MKSTVVVVFVGTPLVVVRCALTQTTLPAGAVNPFHETGLPGIAESLGGITQAGVGQLSVAGAPVTLLMVKSPLLVLTVDPELVSVAEPVTLQPPVSPVKVPPAVVTVSVEAVALKVVEPENFTGEPLPQVTVRL